jgi:hypothetical protein
MYPDFSSQPKLYRRRNGKNTYKKGHNMRSVPEEEIQRHPPPNPGSFPPVYAPHIRKECLQWSTDLISLSTCRLREVKTKLLEIVYVMRRKSMHDV